MRAGRRELVLGWVAACTGPELVRAEAGEEAEEEPAAGHTEGWNTRPVAVAAAFART